MGTNVLYPSRLVAVGKGEDTKVKGLREWQGGSGMALTCCSSREE